MEKTKLETEEEKYPKLKIWLIWTEDPVTHTSSIRSVCTDKKLAEIHERALKDWIRRARDGEHSGEKGNRVVVVEESDANHLYGERMLQTIRNLEKMDRERSI
jgi:transposase-like protein